MSKQISSPVALNISAFGRDEVSLLTPAGVDNHQPQPPAPAAVRVLSSAVLLAGARELVIQHSGDDYRLRVTNQDKLILTK